MSNWLEPDGVKDNKASKPHLTGWNLGTSPSDALKKKQTQDNSKVGNTTQVTQDNTRKILGYQP